MSARGLQRRNWLNNRCSADLWWCLTCCNQPVGSSKLWIATLRSRQQTKTRHMCCPSDRNMRCSWQVSAHLRCCQIMPAPTLSCQVTPVLAASKADLDRSGRVLVLLGLTKALLGSCSCSSCCCAGCAGRGAKTACCPLCVRCCCCCGGRSGGCLVDLSHCRETWMLALLLLALCRGSTRTLAGPLGCSCKGHRETCTAAHVRARTPLQTAYSTEHEVCECQR